MALTSILVALFLGALCSSQSTNTLSAAGSSSSTIATVTVTSVSTLAIVILPSSSTSTSSTFFSYNSTSSTSYVSSTLTSAPTLTSTTLALQSVPFTGQSMLIGTCDIPQYTALPFPDGSMLEVPLVGCSNDRPDCCPSLSLPANVSQAAATNVVSLLNQAPLSICPKDFIDIDPVCCPSGYSLYGQGIVGQTPCYTVMSTTLSVPQTALASISSAVAATISAKSTTAAVSVIINQVFALSLPCGGQSSSSKSGLSTGAKAGIGVGAGAGGLILITLTIWCCLIARKRWQKKAAAGQVPAPTAGPAYAGNATPMYEDKQYTNLPVNTYRTPSAYGSSPPMHPQAFGPHTSWQQAPTAHSGHISVSSDGIQPHGALTPNSPPTYFREMPAYEAQARSQTYEMPEK